jgi:hypothetical protein
MRCLGCDYELWHCTGRKCPECGELFSLRDFEFELDSVLFHCPHCDHGEAGRGSNGWPDLNIEQCAGCGLAIGLDYYIVRPVQSAKFTSYLNVLPIRTLNGNWFSRYFQTVWFVMTKPRSVISSVPIHEPLTKAWFFLITTIAMTFVISMIPTLFLFALPLFSFSGAISSPGVASMHFIIGGQLIAIFVGQLLCVVVWCVMTHAILLMCGGCSFTLKRTMQSIVYSGGASLVNIVPCLGGIAGTVWWIVSAINMVAKAQRVSGKKASLAVLGPPILLLCCCCGFLGFLLF